jgi:predicted nucleic acid-binding Zn ribbon protein
MRISFLWKVEDGMTMRMPRRDESYEERDDGPSAEDLARFSRPGDARCQECGHRVHEDVDICPRCSAFIFADDDSNAKRNTRPLRMLFLLALVLIALVLSGVMAVIVR